MFREKIYEFLSNALDIEVFPSQIPESEKLPAASYYITGMPTDGALAGGVNLRKFYVTVDIATKTNREDLDELAKKIMTFDRQSSEQFQLIDIISFEDVPMLDSQYDYFQCSIDLELTAKTSGL